MRYMKLWLRNLLIDFQSLFHDRLFQDVDQSNLLDSILSHMTFLSLLPGQRLLVYEWMMSLPLNNVRICRDFVWSGTVHLLILRYLGDIKSKLQCIIGILYFTNYIKINSKKNIFLEFIKTLNLYSGDSLIYKCLTYN